MAQFREYRQEKWEDHKARLKWDQGDHMLLIGPTKSGKTELASQVLDKRGWVVGMFNKPSDKTVERQYIKQGWTRYKKLPKRGLANDEQRALIWPEWGSTVEETVLNQKAVFQETIDWLMRTGRRCIYYDETAYLNDMLGLTRQINMTFYFARATGISSVAAMQRPKFVPRVLMSNSTHAYISRTTDREDIKRLSDLSTDPAELAWNLSHLRDRHDFVYINPLGDAEPTVVNTHH